MKRLRIALGLFAVVVFLVSCAQDMGPGERSPEIREIQRDIDEGRREVAATKLERMVARYPGRTDLRMSLMRLHRSLAMDALKREHMREYTDYLQKAYEQGFAILKLEPETPDVHREMAIIAAYQGDVKRAYRSFDNTRRLEPQNPENLLNIAETLVYLGKVGRARHYISRARKMGAHPADSDVLDILAAWRMNDFVEVEHIFEAVYTTDPERIRNWNGPDDPIENWEDFRMHCCALPFCGPYMKKGCPPGSLKSALETVDPETKRRELALEMMRRRELEQIYKDRDIDVRVASSEELERELEVEAAE